MDCFRRDAKVLRKFWTMMRRMTHHVITDGGRDLGAKNLEYLLIRFPPKHHLILDIWFFLTKQKKLSTWMQH